MKFVLLCPIVVVAALLLAACGKKEDAPTVEYIDEDGTITTDINAVDDGTVEFRMRGEGQIPEVAQAYHEQARMVAQTGDYAQAIDLLEKAISNAPDWAYPHYDMAFTYLLINEQGRSLEKFRDVDNMEPEGFFTTKTAIWSLEKEVTGEFPAGLYLAYTMLEWEPEENKLMVVNQMVEKYPAFAPGWKEKALQTEDFVERIDYIDKALSLNPDLETYGILQVNKAVTLALMERDKEAKELLEALVVGDQSTKSTLAIAQEALKNLD
ncbi:MAG: hypothetical protein AAFX93_03885 [Verrucomicrobiota bacterium]